MFDNYYTSIYYYSKNTFGKKAGLFSLYYITLLEFAVLFLILSFFAAFASQMHISTMAFNKAMVLGLLVFIFLLSKNWLRYNGKKRLILRGKNKMKIMLWKLILVPITSISLALIFLQAI